MGHPGRSDPKNVDGSLDPPGHSSRTARTSKQSVGLVEKSEDIPRLTNVVTAGSEMSEVEGGSQRVEERETGAARGRAEQSRPGGKVTPW